MIEIIHEAIDANRLLQRVVEVVREGREDIGAQVGRDVGEVVEPGRRAEDLWA